MTKENTNNRPLNTIGVILSGGAGQRLGGVDKGLEHYRNKPLIEHVIERLKNQVDDIIICANRNLDLYQKYGYRLVVDAEPEQYQGPMAGISAAINCLSKGASDRNNHCLLISSCDSPELPFDHGKKLIQQMQSHSASSSVVHDGVRLQNLHCVIDESAWKSLVQFYDQGGRAMHRWHKKNGSINVNFTDQAASFSNINSTDKML